MSVLELPLSLLTILGAAWLLGILSIMSLGAWSDFYPLDFIPAYKGKGIFDSLDFLAANNLLLVGGMMLSIFFGWLVPKKIKLEEMDVSEGLFFSFWRFMIRFIIPPVLLLALVFGITE